MKLIVKLKPVADDDDETDSDLEGNNLNNTSVFIVPDDESDDLTDPETTQSEQDRA